MKATDKENESRTGGAGFIALRSVHRCLRDYAE